MSAIPLTFFSDLFETACAFFILDFGHYLKTNFVNNPSHTGKAAIKNVNTVDKRRSKSLEIKFLIAICHLTGDKRQSKTLFLAIFYLRSSIVKRVFDCHPAGLRTYKAQPFLQQMDNILTLIDIGHAGLSNLA